LAKINWNLGLSALIAHLPGLLLLGLFYIEFVLLDDSQRHLYLAAFSQMFSIPMVPWVAQIAVLSEPDKMVVSQTSFVAIQWLALAMMLVAFVGGYLEGRLKKKRRTKAEKAE
jgi:hypothetical protein